MPWRCAGSETVMHELLKAAVVAGHDVTLYCTHQTGEKTWTGREPVTEFDGVRIVRCKNIVLAAQAAQRTRPDVWLSHHQHILPSIKAAKRMRARSVYLVHNDMDLNARPLALKPDLVIFNSDWVKESLARFTPPTESMTFHPPLTPDRHRTETTGDAYTLVNLNEHKGAKLFYRLAELEPDRKFLGVVGAHGVQVVRRDLPNVTIAKHTPDMRTIWAQTRVLLMPSFYESYGLTAPEAGLNGIPTIAHPTPGLVENLGSGGMFADRDHPHEWRQQFALLDRPDDYYRASLYAMQRATAALDATRQTLKRWVEWIG
jgi:glycosyltransferase involved in cell wall biosynthesis